MERKHLIVLISVFIIDQLSKYYVDLKMSVGSSIGVIGDFFEITYIRNSGAAFSILEGKMIFFYVFTSIVVVGLLLFYRQSAKNDILARFGLVLMIAGAVGNLFDRVVFQYVRDFLDFNIVGYDFPVFNVADISLCIGVFIILFVVFCEYIPTFARIETKIKGWFKNE